MLTAVTIAVLVHAVPTNRSAAAAAPRRRARASVTPRAAASQVPPPIVLSPLSDVNACASNRAAALVLVSLRRQRVWMRQGQRQVNSSAVTTGAVDHGDGTPTGSWLVQGEQRNRYLVGPGYRDFVRYWVPFNGDFGFHDASWQTMPFGAAGYRTRGSNGCVHLPLAVMAWLYRWVRVGQTVVTVTGA